MLTNINGEPIYWFKTVPGLLMFYSKNMHLIYNISLVVLVHNVFLSRMHFYLKESIKKLNFNLLRHKN